MAVVDVPDRMTLTAPAPDPVATVTVQTVGKPGLATYYYWIVTHFPIGVVVSEPFGIWNAPDDLDGSNYVHIVWPPTAGATSYDLLRTLTAVYPILPGNYAVVTGFTGTEYQDSVVTPTHYDITGLPHGAPVSCLIHLNNRDYSTPVVEMPRVMQVSTLLFPDGTMQTTAGGAAIKIRGSVPTHGDLPVIGDPGDAWIVLNPAPPHLWVWDGLSTWIDAGPAASISAAGSNGQIQYNDGGLFGASPNLAWEIMWGNTVPVLRSNGVNVVDTNPNQGVQVWYDAAINTGQGGIYAFDFAAQVYKRFLLDGNPLVLNGDLNSGGNVGIATANPQHELDVDGDINCTGNYRVNGVAQAFGGASVSTTAPAAPVEGQFWYDPSALRLFVRAGGAWFQV